MNILAVDTTTKVASVCIMKDDKYFEKSISNEVTHSEKLLPLIDETLKEASLNIKDIDMYSALNGPGSFTGIRIGLATLKAFAMVNGKKIFSIPSDTAIAICSKLGNYKKSNYFATLIDAKNSRVYYSLYSIFENDNKLEIVSLINTDNDIIDNALEKISQKINKLNITDKIIFAGNIVNCYKEKINNIFSNCDTNEIYPTPKDSILAYKTLEKKDEYIFDTYTLDANYVRPSQAERIKKIEK